MRLTDEDFWNKNYSGIYFQDQNEHDVANFLNRYLENGNGKTSLEVGSFPGSFLPTIARKGYLVHGVDFNHKNSTELPEWIESLGFKVGTFWTADFFDFINKESKTFDLVCSFGLIEHFENYKDVIEAQLKLVSPSGQLVITTPNFRGGMQYIPHLLFDKANLKKHYLPSMNPLEWKKILEKNGFEVKFSGYFGGYHFWVDQNSSRNKFERFWLRFTQRSISQLSKILRKLKIESPTFSSYCGIVAQRK